MASEDLAKKVGSEDPQMMADINKYIDDLKNSAQGNYDFIVKFLKKSFETALGGDDKERAKFFATVADVAEKRMGRIPYDYEKYSGREKEDLDNFLKQKDMEDTEQRKQEVEFEKQQALETKKEKKGISESASSRGMLDSGIEKRQQSEAAEERRTNIQDPQDRVFAYKQAIRDEQKRLGIAGSARTQDDIKTKYRRAGEDTQGDYDQGVEGAKMTLSDKLAAIERTRRGELERGSQIIEDTKTRQASQTAIQQFKSDYGIT
jgi:hypothetical protein